MCLACKVAILALLLLQLSNAEEWSWGQDTPNGFRPTDDKTLEAKDQEPEDTYLEEQVNTQNITDVEQLIDNILTSKRKGRNLDGYDEVYSDPSVLDAIQKGNEGQARNVIKDRLCSLGLMQCDGEFVQEKRPYISPEDLVYAQPVDIKPIGRPVPSIPVKGPIRGTYGPPKPIPYPHGPSSYPVKYGSSHGSPLGPHGPPRRYGPASKPLYPGSPNKHFLNGPISSGAAFEGPDEYISKPQDVPPFTQPIEPYEFDHFASSASFHKEHKPTQIFLNSQEGGAHIGGASSGSEVQQHVHHHFHHGQKDIKIPTAAVVGNPIGHAIHGTSSNFGESILESSLFKPTPPTGFIGSNFGSGYRDQTIFSGVKPTIPPLTIGGSGFSGSNYGGQTIVQYGQSSSGLGNYGATKPVVDNYGPAQFGTPSSLYGSSNSLGASVGSYGSTGFYKKALNLNQGLLNGNSIQSSYAGAYQGLESARAENYDCICVPYDQCPTQNVIGRKDDLYLAIDPRNLKSDIEAISEERVITDGNGTMTVIRVPKDVGTNATDEIQAEEEEQIEKDDVKKVAKREAPVEDKNKSKVEARQSQLNDRKVQPTFGVSFGLPHQGGGGYPINPYGPNPHVNPYGSALGGGGINLGLVSVNPLISVQVTKDDYGEKVVKPFVNLHVTPNDFLVHKFEDFFQYKKGVLFNKHQHVHHYKPHYPHRPPYYHGPPFIHGPPVIHGPTYPHRPPFVHHGPPVYEGPPIHDDYSESDSGSYDGGYHDDSDNYYGGDYSGGYDDGFLGRVAQNTTLNHLINQYQQQYDKNKDSYGNSYNNYQPQSLDSSNSRKGKNLPSSTPIKFPTSRKRRDVTDARPEFVKPAKSEKRQAYYPGSLGRPTTCGPRHVCCRRPTRPYVPPVTGFGQAHQCGTRHSQGINGRIKNPVYIDGDSEFGEYPWQVAILKKDPKESVYVCGGTLIDNLHILTAAHCVKSYSPYDLRVRLGEWDVNHDVEFYPYIEGDISAVEVHPEFYAGTLYNDLAILRLDKPVDWTKYPHISPACLPFPNEDYTGQRCWTTGWGKDAFGEFGKYQNILKEVDVPVVGFAQCQQQMQQTRLGYDFKLHPGFVCAGGEEGKDACKGDGGGPMVCERGGTWKIVGVVSWGIGCGQHGVPGVYVKVAHYLYWVRQITQRY